MSTSRIIILGTGTGVGKTWVASSITRALRRSGVTAVALKPIETGVEAGAEGSDATLLRRESSIAPAAPPFVFPDPVSPHLAARRRDRTIELRAVSNYVDQHEARIENEVTSHVMSFLIIETAGGCLSPLAAGVTNYELAKALDPAVWILVAPDSLGVLHDVRATLEALTARGRRPDHLVLSVAREPDASTGTNAAELEGLGILTPAASAARGDERSLDGLARLLVESARKTAES